MNDENILIINIIIINNRGVMDKIQAVFKKNCSSGQNSGCFFHSFCISNFLY